MFSCTSLKVSKGLIKEIGITKNNNFIIVPNNLYIIPGLIDEHIHGSNGDDVMNATPSSLLNIAKSILQDGVTSFCPTTMTMAKHNIIEALKNITDCINQKNNDSAKIIGAHLEGPFISAKYKGAQNGKDIIKCNVDDFKDFLEACPYIKEVTLAYEEKGQRLLSFLKNHHITASIGHSDCKSDLLIEGINNGITCATHTYNAMRPLHHREIGIVGTVLLDDRINAELICDLIHVSPNAIKLLYKCKKEKIILITDSMEARHLNKGIYSLGGQKVIVKDGVARLKDGTLAGSTLTLNKALYNFMNVLNLKFNQVIDYATINPAKNLNLDKLIGSIEEGKNADFTIIDDEFNVYATIVNGNILYKKEDYKWLK